MDGTGKIGGGTSGHGDQRTDKNTAPFFSGSGALCKVYSPFSLLCFCMLLLREDMDAFIKKGLLYHRRAENEPDSVSLWHKAENQ